VAKTSRYLLDKLEGLKSKYPFVTEVRGRGLLLAVQFQRDIAQDVLMACLEKGLLVNRVKPDAIRLVPPLIINNREIDQAVGILDEVLSGIVI
jgi:acetylornithine/succinyldiaminopimelate/putrescine aminotransferase